jgi:hypothetical protein
MPHGTYWLPMALIVPLPMTLIVPLPCAAGAARLRICALRLPFVAPPLRSSRSQPDRQSPWTLTILLPHSATFIFLIQEHPLLLEVSIASRGLLLQLM